MLPGFAERLEEEVNRLTPSGITPKVTNFRFSFRDISLNV